MGSVSLRCPRTRSGEGLGGWAVLLTTGTREGGQAWRWGEPTVVPGGPGDRHTHNCGNPVMLLGMNQQIFERGTEAGARETDMSWGDLEVRRPKLFSLDQNQHAGRPDFPEGLGGPASLPSQLQSHVPHILCLQSHKHSIVHGGHTPRPGPTPSTAG